MPEQIPLMVDAATQELRQFASDETIPQGQLLSALQVALTGLDTSNVSGVLESDTILQALGKLQAQASNKVDKVAGKQLSAEDYTSDEKEKLSGIAAGATANSTDAALRDRANHTGTQAISTVSGLQTALDSKETPAGALAQMQGFGLGGMTPAVPVGTDFLAYPWKTGFYTLTGSYLNQPFSGSTGQLIVTVRTFGAGPAVVFLLFNNSTADFWIGRSTWATSNPDGSVVIGSANSITWRQIAGLDSPAFTGTPSTPNLKFGNAVSSDVNTLDYYEKGTFVPEFFGSTTAGTPTYSFQYGFYTRIGDRVMWSLRIGLSSKGGMAGALRIKAMPFNTRGHTAARGACSVSLMSGLVASNTFSQLLAIHVHGNPIVDLLKYTTGQAGSGLFYVTDVTDSFEIYLSGTYQV